MERGMDESYSKARERLTRATLIEIREVIERVGNFTSFNVLPKFTPAQVETLMNHLDECHKILFELSELNDYEMPYKCPKLIYAARELRRVVS